MLAQFSIFPIGQGAHLRKYVAAALDEVDKSGLDYRLTSMGTLIEGDWDAVLSVLKNARNRVLEMTDRVYLTISIDDCRKNSSRILAKAEAVEKALGRKLRR